MRSPHQGSDRAHAEGEGLRAFVAAGSNLDREGWGRGDFLSAARRRLEQSPGVTSIAMSRVHETEPLGAAGQPKYLNQVFAVETTLGPRELLDTLLAVERSLGRERSSEKWGPRFIDLDLLLYDDRVIAEPGLTVPHPHLHERRFVLAPLAELAPDAVHPLLRKTVRELLDALPPGAL